MFVQYAYLILTFIINNNLLKNATIYFNLLIFPWEQFFYKIYVIQPVRSTGL